MKRKNRLMILTLASLSMLGLSGCKNKDIQVTDLTSITESTTVVDDKIMEVYQAYKANGGTLDYDAWLASIKGEKGEKGDKGDPGTPGTPGNPGEPGTPGADGKSILTGTADPESTLGNDGDVYLNSETFDLFKKEDGAWVRIGNIKGQDGTNGDRGTSFLTGNGEPASTLGYDGDVYLDGDTYYVYKKISGEWAMIGSIMGQEGKQGDKGDKGDKGDAGATAYGSTILPSENGVISVNVGSAEIGESVTFTFTPSTGYLLKTFTINGVTRDSSEARLTKNIYSYTLPMVKNGFVVSAAFEKQVVVSTAEDFKSAVESNTTAITLRTDIDLSSTIIDESLAFTNMYYLQINLSGHTINFGNSNQNSLSIKNGFKLSFNNGALTSTGSHAPINANSSTVSFNGVAITTTGTVVECNGGTLNYINSTITSTTSAIVSKATQNTAIINLNSSTVTTSKGSGIFIANSSYVNLQNCNITAPTAIDMRLGNLNISGGEIKSSMANMHVLSRDEALTKDQSFYNDDFDGEGVSISIKANFIYGNESTHELTIEVDNTSTLSSPVVIYDLSTSGESEMYNVDGSLKTGYESFTNHITGLEQFITNKNATRYVVTESDVIDYVPSTDDDPDEEIVS